ncbi:MAG: M67 family metallopeptidase [Actinobacteria bacterium]|nr:MAG: M67 family metallopeptidase [Actinomycetota bacterium]
MALRVRRLLERGRRRHGDGANSLVVIPEDVRAELVAHAEREAPNEACGLVLLRDGRAERYEPGRNGAASPYRFELELDDPEVWFAEDDGYELAVFHSHLSSPARPSRTDVENVGLWAGRPYLILSLRSRDLAAFTIEDGRIEELPLTS